MRPFSDIFFHCGFEYRLGSALFATVEQQQTRAKRISHLSWEKVKLYIKPFSGARILQCIILPQKYLKNASEASIFQCPKSPKSACVHLKDKQSSKRAGQKSRARFWKAHAQTTKDKQSSLRSRIGLLLDWKTLCLSYELQLSRFIVLMPLLRDLLAL